MIRLAKIREWLGISRDSAVSLLNDRTNMRVISIGGIITACIEFLILIQAHNFAVQNVSVGKRQMWMQSHVPAYLLLLGISLLVTVYAHRFLKKDSRKHGQAMMISILYMVSGVAFGAYISYMDYISGDQIFTFFSMCFCTAALLIVPPIFSTLFYFLMFYVYFQVLNHITPWTTGSRINYDLVCLILVLVGIFRYNVARFDAKNQLAIERMLRYDVLTGARNLRSLEQDRRNYIGEKSYFLAADIDDFKYFNDRFGHAAGDDVIKRVVYLAEQLLNCEGRVYRINGDEICVLIAKSNLEDVLDYAKRWMDGVREIRKDGYEMYINMSMGIAYGTPHTQEDVVALQRCADRKMFEARKQGGNRILMTEFNEKEKRALDSMMNNSSMDAHNLDVLTNLPNLVLFRERAQKIMVNMQKNEIPYAYVFFDIQNFRHYNERYGFQSGDMLLKQMAVVLQNTFSGSLITRIGEDHYIVITEMDHMIERIEDIHRSLHTFQQEVHLELKAGIYQPQKDDFNVSQACDRAKMVCDSIKNDYNAVYKYYDNDIMKELEKRQYIVTHIDEAIENGYIQVYYHPIIRTISGEVCGAEALARWNDPVYGFLEPKEFIDSLEQNRLIYKVDAYVARQVCKDHMHLREAGYAVTPISINMSRLDFEAVNVVKLMEDVTNEFRVPHDMIHIEVTESTVTDSGDYMQQEMGRLQKKGYQVWMDDFGSGYSSLNVMQDYQFDVIKMDMVFLKNYQTSMRSREILASMVNMCKKLGVRILAEGVETQDQLEFLKSIGCEMAQGYLFSQPMPLEEIVRRIEADLLTVENRARRDYYDTIGRINVLSQAPMDYFSEVMKKATQNSEQIFFSGFPLAIAEYVEGREFRYILANDKYNELMRLIKRGSLKESEMLINNLSDKYKDSFREGLRRSKQKGTMEVVEYEIDGRKYVTHMRYITSMRNRDAILLALENTSYNNLTIV